MGEPDVCDIRSRFTRAGSQQSLNFSIQPKGTKKTQVVTGMELKVNNVFSKLFWLSLSVYSKLLHLVKGGSKEGELNYEN